MAMSKEEKNARAAARRAAAKAAKAAQTVESESLADMFEAVEPVSVESSAIVPTGPIQVEGQFIEVDPAERVRIAESRVVRLIDAQSGVDAGEHESILGMIEDCRTNVATPTEFCEAYAKLAKGRMTPDSAKSRKSNLKGVLTFATESQEFVLKITAPESGILGLQAMYKLRNLMLKGPDGEKPKRARSEGNDDGDGTESNMSPNDLMLHQINNAIDAAADAGHADIAERLRAVFYLARAAIVEKESTEPTEEPEAVEA